MAKAYVAHAHNIEFAELTETLGGIGMTQLEIATALGISPGYVSRIKSGERKASVSHLVTLRNEVRRINNERSVKVGPRAFLGRSPFEVDQAVFCSLSVTESVKAFRDLLWARASARGIPTTRVSVSGDIYKPDGGVDASILEGDEVFVDDELLSPGTRFQIKTGKFKPWAQAQVRNELFGNNNEPAFENLGSEIQATLRQNKRFVMVCFGVDPTDENIRTARRIIEDFFAACGYPEALVDVWGQIQLIGLFQTYPSLCLRLRRFDFQGIRSHESWAEDDDMRKRRHYSIEQQHLVNDLQDSLRSKKTFHLRLTGEPGIGKSRLAFEITSAEDLAPLTLYVRDGQTLLQSVLLNELLQVDDRRFAIIVIDECSKKDLAEIWNLLKPRSDRIRIITIDHTPDNTTDDKTRKVSVKQIETEQIFSILLDYNLSKNDAHRWAEYCEGCPRVAHVLGSNLQINPTNLLAAPSTSEVWERFIDGYDARDSEIAQLRRTVLHYCALFERFGFKKPVEKEAKFIQDLASKYDPRITESRFNQLIVDLQDRRIIQGFTTLFITPRLLHIYLYREFWRQYAGTFDITSFSKGIPPQLWDWFIEMLRFAHDCPTAELAIDNLLGADGPFLSGQFPDSRQYGRMLYILAETSPKKTLKRIKSIICTRDTKELCALRDSVQWIVSALEKIAVWEDCFIPAAELLLQLAEADNYNSESAATNAFVNLFSLLPGWCPTQASPDLRHNVLSLAINSDSVQRRRLGLKACANALNRFPSHRIVGSEHQGLRPTITFWLPKTYGELWDGYREVWRLLVDRLVVWKDDNRKQLISTIIEAAWSTLQIEPLSEMVVHTLASIASDQQTDIKALVELVDRNLAKPCNLSSSTIETLKAMRDQLNGNDFKSTLLRFVKYPTDKDYFGDDDEKRLVETKLSELVALVRDRPELLCNELPWLIRLQSNAVYHFALRIGRSDPERYWLPVIRDAYTKSPGLTETAFLTGYLKSIFESDIEIWEQVMFSVAADPATADRFSDFVLDSGLTNSVTRQVIIQCNTGLQSKAALGRWWAGHRLAELDEDVIDELITLQLAEGTGVLWKNAVQMCHAYFIECGRPQKLSEALIYRVLTSEAMIDGRSTYSVKYYWLSIAKRFALEYPDRELDLFEALLRMERKGWRVADDLDEFLTAVIQKDPTRAWKIISTLYDEARERKEWLSGHWLSANMHQIFEDGAVGPIQYFPVDLLFSWVDKDIDERAYWLTRTLPRTLSRSPCESIARSFLIRYGRSESVRRSLLDHFLLRSLCGNASDRYRSLTDEARLWLSAETNNLVAQWIEEYIEMLAAYIVWAEVDEERRGR
jgi:hypothetical protein